MAGSLAVALYYTPFSILQAFGDSKTPLIFQIICSVLNIVLDILFVIPPLNWGVAGAAIATVISQVIAAVICLINSVKKVPQFQEAFQHLKPDFTVMRQIIRIGIPSGFQYSLLYISSLFLQAIVNGFGEIAVGAYTATTQIEMLAVQIPNAIATAMPMAATGMLIESFFLIAYSGTRVTLYTLNGAGDSSFSVVNGIIEITARILFGFTLTSVPFIGVWGIWLTTGFTWIVTSATALLQYKSGMWKKKGIVG